MLALDYWHYMLALDYWHYMLVLDYCHYMLALDYCQCCARYYLQDSILYLQDIR